MCKIIMPIKSKRPCSYNGCPNLIELGQIYCQIHKTKAAKQYDKDRGTSTSRGYDSNWRKARIRYLREHPLCVECLKENRIVEATVVDHIIPHKGDMVLFWNESNWQSLCKSCHDRKTVKQDGGFGRIDKK